MKKNKLKDLKKQLLEQKVFNNKYDSKTLKEYKDLKAKFLIKELEKTTGKKVILEAASALAGLPQHWLKFITNTTFGWGKYTVEDIKKIKLKFTLKDKSKLLLELKNSETVAILAYEGTKPVMMIVKRNDNQNKFHIFTEKPGGDWVSSKGKSWWQVRKIKTNNVFSINTVLEEMTDAPNWTLYSLKIDKNRAELIAKE